MTAFRVKWYHTEEFEADIELDDAEVAEAREFDTEDGIDTMLEEKLMDAIVNMDQKQLSLAFQGCTDREITEKTELES
jgi:hypothetical protein